MRDITIAAPFVEQSIAGARDAGYDGHRILKECGISPELLDQPRARVSLDRFIRLNRRLMRLMNDEAIGLMEQPQRIGSFEMVARSALHGPDLRSAMREYARGFNLLENGFDHEVRIDGEQVHYLLHRRSQQSTGNDYIAESTALTAHRFFCWLCHTRIRLTGVSLDYPAPPWRREYQYLFYGAPVTFRARDIALTFRNDDLNLPLKRDIRSLETYIERAPRDIFTPQRNQSLSHRIRERILESIRSGSGVPTMQQIATRLDIHPQTLRRRLRSEQTSFTELRTEARRDMAISLLSRGNSRIEAIAEQLGFSESSAFVRAFRDWMGMTPLAYRRM